MERSWENVTGPLRLDLDVPAGRIAVDAHGGDTVDVTLEPLNEAASGLLEAVVLDVRRRGDGHELVVDVPERRGFRFLGRGPEFELRVRCPEHPSVKVRTASADFEGRGVFASLELQTASGDVEVERVDGDTRIQSASGDVELGAARGSAEVHTASGDVRVARIDGPLRARLVSGDLLVEDARGDVEGHTVSGDHRLDAVSGGLVTLESVSGDIRVGVRKGTNVWMDVRSLSGETSSELAPTDGPSAGDEPLVELRIKSVSGDVRIESAAAAQSV